MYTKHIHHSLKLAPWGGPGRTEEKSVDFKVIKEKAFQMGKAGKAIKQVNKHLGEGETV